MFYLRASITTRDAHDKGVAKESLNGAAGMSESQRAAIGRLEEQLNAVKERL